MKAIVSVDENWSIGNKNKLLFSIKDDMRNFKIITMNSSVIVMGRKTLESIGKLLPNRLNIIISSKGIDKELYPEEPKNGTKLLVFSNIDSALEYILENDLWCRTCIIGGSSIYEQFLPYCNSAIVTKVYREFEADSYFPDLDKLDNWQLIDRSPLKVYHRLHYDFNEYINLDPVKIDKEKEK